MPRKPNLFIIGAAKSGTTSLHHYLAAHPDIFLSEPKEPGFFAPDVGHYPTSVEWYLGLFERAGGARYAGESSTHYTKRPVHEGVVDRIAAFVEEPPRFIYLMRDPIDRTISHYWHDLRKFQEHRPLDRAIEERVEYRSISDYSLQLEPYFDRFGEESVHALTFEELVRNPAGTVRAVLKWLDLDPTLPHHSFERLNARPDTFRRVRGVGFLDRLARSAGWSRLSQYLPQSLKDLGKGLAYREVDPKEEDVQRAVERLRPEMCEVAQRVGRLLDRRFPEWTTTFPPAADRPSNDWMYSDS